MKKGGLAGGQTQEISAQVYHYKKYMKLNGGLLPVSWTPG
jgi:hypothetical protein